ncbi:MAG: tetratricopeptide repeat protein [Dehalococcoidia bacterium]|nr:tetratricopeptide repeat protein [Dehalococcoidia bacterium]
MGVSPIAKTSPFLEGRGQGGWLKLKGAWMGRSRWLVMLFLVLAISACGGSRGAVEHNNTGFQLEGQGLFGEAIAEYDEAIRLKPDYAEAYSNRGEAYRNLAQYERAIQDLDKAIGLDPKYAVAYSNRGAAYDSQGQFERAIQDYDKALSLDLKYALAYGNRAVAYAFVGKVAEARQDIERAVGLGYDRARLEQAVEVAKQKR